MVQLIATEVGYRNNFKKIDCFYEGDIKLSLFFYFLYWQTILHLINYAPTHAYKKRVFLYKKKIAFIFGTIYIIIKLRETTNKG